MLKKRRKKFNISKNNLGILLCSLSCILFWFPYSYTEHHFFFNRKEYLSLLPTLLTGMAAFTLVSCLYIRGIFTVQKTKTSLFAFLINLTLFATVFEIFISPGREKPIHNHFSISTFTIGAFMIAIILFGVKEIAKISCILLLFSILLFRLKLVSDVMGFFGYIAFLLMISGLYLQEAINPRALKHDCYYLIGKN